MYSKIFHKNNELKEEKRRKSYVSPKNHISTIELYYKLIRINDIGRFMKDNSNCKI